MAKKKRSLVENINQRRKKGISRGKSRSTVSTESYREMRRGWPKSRTRKTKQTRRAGTAKRSR